MGTPRTSSEDSAKYTLTAYNRLGRVSAEVAIMVLEAPHDFRCLNSKPQPQAFNSTS